MERTWMQEDRQSNGRQKARPMPQHTPASRAEAMGAAQEANAAARALRSPYALTPATLMALQRSVGNAAVNKLLQEWAAPPQQRTDDSADQVAPRSPAHTTANHSTGALAVQRHEAGTALALPDDRDQRPATTTAEPDKKVHDRADAGRQRPEAASTPYTRTIQGRPGVIERDTGGQGAIQRFAPGAVAAISHGDVDEKDEAALSGEAKEEPGGTRPDSMLWKYVRKAPGVAAYKLRQAGKRGLAFIHAASEAIKSSLTAAEPEPQAPLGGPAPPPGPAPLPHAGPVLASIRAASKAGQHQLIEAPTAAEPEPQAPLGGLAPPSIEAQEPQEPQGYFATLAQFDKWRAEVRTKPRQPLPPPVKPVPPPSPAPSPIHDAGPGPVLDAGPGPAPFGPAPFGPAPFGPAPFGPAPFFPFPDAGPAPFGPAPFGPAPFPVPHAGPGPMSYVGTGQWPSFAIHDLAATMASGNTIIVRLNIQPGE